MIHKSIAILLVSVSISAMGEDIVHNSIEHKAHRAAKRLDTTPIDVEDGAWLFGIESTTYANTGYLNPTVTYSGTNGWDISLSLYNIPVYGSRVQRYEYDSYVAITKNIDVTDNTSIVIGTQNGTTLFPNAAQRWHNLDFANARYNLTNRIAVYSGTYFANKALTTVANEVGFMAGFETKLIPGTLHLQGDYMSGHTAVSGAEVDLQWFATPNAQLYIGVIIPEKNSGNEFVGVIGFNISTKYLK